MANWGPGVTAVFFVSFYLGNAVVLINIVVAVLLEKMVEDDLLDENPEEEDEFDEEERVPGGAERLPRRASPLVQV